MKQIFTLSLFLIFSFLSFGQFNAVETFTSANGLSNDGCSDVLVENDGTVWVGHDFYSQPSLNGMPISRRQPNGTWDYPFSSVGLPLITVNGSPYQWTSFAVKEIYQRANGEIWFIAKAGNSSDMNNAPPILVFHNGNFSARHISLNNFPNKGAVHTMVEDIYGYLWFGCEEGLVKLNANTGLFSTYNPPSETIVSGRIHDSKRIFSIDYDANGRILMLTGFPTSLPGSQSLLRIFDQHNLTWDYWTHRDAPWWSATQTDYAPSDIVALRDIQNRPQISHRFRQAT